jgi:hypothetical protein
MKWVIVEKMEYNGRQILPYWAERYLGISGDCIVAFRGKCDVAPKYMVDIEDKEKGEKIYSPDMLHFIVEHFDSSSIELAYARQRILVFIAQEKLGDLGYICSRDGGDLFYNGKKLSVSIASVSRNSQKIHFGINVESDEYMSLSKMGIKNPEKIMREICVGYCSEIEDITKDIHKTKPLEELK